VLKPDPVLHIPLLICAPFRQAGADPFRKDLEGKTAMDLAVHFGNQVSETASLVWHTPISKRAPPISERVLCAVWTHPYSVKGTSATGPCETYRMTVVFLFIMVVERTCVPCRAKVVIAIMERAQEQHELLSLKGLGIGSCVS
jgi:hypothetical protein